MKRLCSALLCLALAAGTLAGCSTGEAPGPSPSASPEASQAREESYTIGLVQYKESAAPDALREAFMGRLEEWGCGEDRVKIDYQNAQGDRAKAEEICVGFVERDVDMIVAIAPQAAQAALSAAKGTEVAVVFAGVGESSVLGLDGGKATGVASPTPVEALVDLARQADASLKTLGLLYDPEEPSSQAEAQRVKAYCAKLELAVEEAPVSSEEEAAAAAAELCVKVDALYTPADSTLFPAASQIAEAAKGAGVPWYAGDEAMVQAGALACLGVTARQMGVQAADMAVQLMEGRDLSEVPVYTFNEAALFVNQATLDALPAVSIPAESLQTAYLYQ